MNPHNELVEGSTEAYCLAEPGAQYVVYVPTGGDVKLDLTAFAGEFEAKWLDPRTGEYSDPWTVTGGAIRTFTAPAAEDWVMIVTSA